MRIVFDGRQVERLDPKIARKIRFESDVEIAEGYIVSADQIISDSARRNKIGLITIGALIAAILIVATIITLAYEPDDMLLAGPLFAAILAAMAIGGPALYQRSLTDLRDKTQLKLARMAQPGIAVRLNATAITLGESTVPWSEVTVEEVEIVTDRNPDGPDDYHVEAIVLEAVGEAIVLDRSMITNGALLIDKTLRILDINFLL